MRKKNFLFLTIIASFFCLIPFVQSACSGEVDMTTVVSSVIDGDTFDVTAGERIRLADVDAPEYYEEGYDEARDFLISLVLGKTVHLDIDDVDGVYSRDPYGRLVCVVYLECNTTHVKNINKALLVEGVAVIDNYPNEFDPYTWSLYCLTEVIPEFPSFLVLPLFAVLTLLIGMRAHRTDS
jgi:endonuclease YncB( thermonuclease family)